MQIPYKKVAAQNGTATLVSENCFRLLTSSGSLALMGNASETLFALTPVTFRYRKEVDPARAVSFGLIAEDVAQASPELITRDQKGNPQTVRYEAVNAMLLNEFLKEHRHVQEEDKIIARQQKQMEALTAGLQKVSAQLQANNPVSQVVNNNQ